MANSKNKLLLRCRWCFVRNELVVSFPSSQLAIEYQRMNPEGRIYAPTGDNLSVKDVYLPRPEGLISIRSSSQAEHYSLALEFRSETEARQWNEKVSISTIFPDRSKTHAYINKWFAISSQNPEPRTSFQQEDPRLKPRERQKHYDFDKFAVYP